jgi:hypothetical protein
MQPGPKPDRRRYPRLVRRIPCELYISGKRHSGLVQNISSGGLFVQTRADAPPGAPITIVFAPGRERTEIRVTGRVMRNERIQADPAMQSALGIAVEVLDPGALDRLLSDLLLARS